MRVILASASPRRADLLGRTGLAFAVEPAEIDERLQGDIPPERAALELARQKARAVAERHRGERTAVIGADTVVALWPADGRGPPSLLGKPAGPGDAAAMLRSLSGSRHAVITGVCVVDVRGGGEHADFERTWVRMRALSELEIAAYVQSGEWRGKAGGYAIQESADRFVTALEEGGFDNVVGLPTALALRLLARAGVAIPEAAG